MNGLKVKTKPTQMSNEIDEADKKLYVYTADRHGNSYLETHLTLENLDEQLQLIREYYIDWLKDQEELINEWEEMRQERDSTSE